MFQVDLEDLRTVTSDKAKVCSSLQNFKHSSCDSIQEMAAELGIQYYETSAATGQGVEEAVEALLSLVMARIERSLEEERRRALSQESQLGRRMSMR